MIDSLTNPILYEDNHLRMNLCPKLYYTNNSNNKLITLPYANSITVEYNGVLTFIAIHKPTKYEVGNCERITLTSKFDWYSEV